MILWMSPWLGSAVIAATLITAGSAAAGQLVIVEENDTFGLDRPSDRHFTQGLRLEYSWVPDPDRALAEFWSEFPLYSDPVTYSQAVGFAQNMYTPEVITDPVYNPADRPFAAWMYLTWKHFVTDGFSPPEWQDTYELNVGTVGPRAQGDEIQSWFHERIGDPDNPTYVNEIPNQWVVMVAASRRWIREVTKERVNWPLFIMPSVALRAGNALMDVGLGTMMYWGFRAPHDFSVGALSPSAKGDANPGAFRLYAHVGIESRLMVFNAFLDGTAGNEESASIGRNDLVTDYKAGITISKSWFRGSFTQVWRSPEIESRSNFQNFGSLQLGFGSPF